ncbi:DedA family protein [Flavobacterium sp. CBA20B-1]|uniref:DedA family protein n=1 Tax=unclassified Flavobacterium TaxID=196869 RepID=UPI0022249FF1|nr:MULTISPECIES: DedA family protein [unclassified Flavobacterium]WCM42776.1 DedA family protein [Flavobacterium sp. CBA20B-1]
MELIDFILHIDQYLEVFLQDYGVWVYAILFLIIFVETGLVVMPFLPGDSLLFATGMLAAQFPESLNVWLVMILLFIAAVLGDTVNYSIGKQIGMRIINFKILGKQPVTIEHINKTHSFYEKYGSKTIVIARFVPIVRTLAPFVAGIGRMNYATFLTYNFVGGFIWVFGITLAGYFLGNIPLIKDNFSKVVLLIILLSVLPIIYSVIKEKLSSNKNKTLS